MTWLVALLNLFRRRHVPMTDEQITALAADADAFEETFGCHVRGPEVILDEEDAR